MSLLPQRIPFDRAAIDNIKTIEDLVRWQKSFIRELDLWWEKMYDNIENGGFETNSWRTQEQANGDLKLQRKIAGVWTDAGTVLGSSTLGDMQFVNDVTADGVIYAGGVQGP